MLKPLEQWICDICGEVIEKSEDGYVIWQYDDDHFEYDFKVIHQSKCDNGRYPSSMVIDSFLGEDGRTYLLSFLSLGPIKGSIGQVSRIRVKNMDEFVDFFRRMQIPYYEEARAKFSCRDVLDDFYDANEVFPYQVEILRRIVENYDAE